LQRLPEADQRRLRQRIDDLADNPRPLPPTGKKLRGRDDLWRVRAGRYRAIYRIDDEARTILVLDVGHRRDVYRRR